MFDDVIVSQNLHWSGKEGGQFIHRSVFSQLLRYLHTPHVVSITGVRRSGKSTLLKQLIRHLIEIEGVNAENILFLNLEHPYFSEYSTKVKYLEKIYEDYLKLTNPKGKIYLLLDELQFFSQWPIFVKSHFEQKKIKFFITGSNSALLSSDMISVLSGRTLAIEVFPLSFRELTTFLKIPIGTHLGRSQNRHVLRGVFDRYIQFGGFPEVISYSDKNLIEEVLNSYAKTILYQDVAPRLSIRKALDLERLFVYLASHIGKMFSYHKLAQLFGLSDKSIKEYIHALEQSYLIFQIEAFSFSLKSQVRSLKKIYAIDTGLINALAFKLSEDLGRLLENVVFLMLKRMKFKIFYYKTQQDFEIDFVIQKGRARTLIQVALSLHNQETRDREIRALVHAVKELKVKQAVIVTLEEIEDIQVDGIHIAVIPVYQLLLLPREEREKLLVLKA